MRMLFGKERRKNVRWMKRLEKSPKRFAVFMRGRVAPAGEDTDANRTRTGLEKSASS